MRSELVLLLSALMRFVMEYLVGSLVAHCNPRLAPIENLVQSCTLELTEIYGHLIRAPHLIKQD